MRILSNKEYKDLINENEELTKTIIFHYLKYSELQDKVYDAIECIKNRNTTKSKKERFMSGETTLEKVLEILGDKENGEI